MRSNASLVELFLLFEKVSLFLFGSFFVHAFPFPFAYTAGEGARTAAHVTDEIEVP